jgi:uncharacterized Zn finger protein (UPF0148 family)
MSHDWNRRQSFKISTLVDHSREGRFVVAFCPICDHAEEVPAPHGNHAKAANASIENIQRHVRRNHRTAARELKISIAANRKES